ncbi:MAG: ABC transporter permease [Acidobacteriota bacterium]|nr:ABC transporter permease [Acidobacteriota bacterium]
MKEHLMEIKVLTWRAFLHSKRTPMVLIAGLIQPLIWLLLFSSIFKNSPMANLAGSGSYLAFITPGALVFTAFTGALNGGVPILFDRELGFLDRLLAAPLRSRLSIIWANGLHIFIMTLLQCLVIIGLTAIMGVRMSGGPMGMVVIIAVLALISLLFTTLSLTLAFMLKRHFELISIVMIISLPMAFISTAFAPVDYMPTWLTWFVAVNPITLAVEPLREVFFTAQWTWSESIFAAPFGNLSVTACLIALLVLNLLMSLAARGVIGKKLK